MKKRSGRMLNKSLFALGGMFAVLCCAAVSPAHAEKVFTTEPWVLGGLATKADTSYVATAINNLIPTTQKGAADGVASLGADGKVPSAQLPAQVQADWNQATNTAADYIKNKPTTAPNDAALVHTTGDESIAGTKTFAGAVVVPAQTLP
jgi:hypothetical protein